MDRKWHTVLGVTRGDWSESGSIAAGEKVNGKFKMLSKVDISNDLRFGEYRIRI